jgi:O-methyltransferase involved in polyketide biosynthesis
MADVPPMAFYCCGIRAQDAQDGQSAICGDLYATEFMNSSGWEVLSRFDGRGDKATKAANLVRARIFDDEIARHLKGDPNLQVVNLGCGFDSRPYRQTGGRWVEIDEPALIAHKNGCLSADECPNPLQRIGAVLPDGLPASSADENALVVIEGVLMYLDGEQIATLLSRLQTAFPRHTLICELIDKTFLDRFMNRNTRAQLAALGSPFKLMEQHPEQLFLDSGYQPVGRPLSVTARGCDLKAFPASGLLRLLLNTALRPMRDGYQVHTFRFDAT